MESLNASEYEDIGGKVYRSILEGMGFCGRLLDDMLVLVKTDEELQELESFIINHDGEFNSNLLVSRNFRELRLRLSPVSKLEFVTDYKNTEDVQDKILCLENLLKAKAPIGWVKQFDKAIHSGDTTLDDFYQAFIDNPNLPLKRLITVSIRITEEVN